MSDCRVPRSQYVPSLSDVERLHLDLSITSIKDNVHIVLKMFTTAAAYGIKKQPGNAMHVHHLHDRHPGQRYHPAWFVPNQRGLRTAVTDLAAVQAAAFIPAPTDEADAVLDRGIAIDGKHVLKVEVLQSNEALLQIINLFNQKDCDMLSIGFSPGASRLWLTD